MNIGKIEIWIHDHVLKNDTIRHGIYSGYQRALYLVSPKIKAEGQISVITPDDENEYLFGYYDKCPWSDDGRYLLALRVKNASKEPDSCEPADVVRIDLSTKQVEKLVTTHSWNVQQGCMAQWLSDDKILYNDFRNGKYCAVVLNLKTQVERIIDMPVYAMSPDRTTALSLDFSRLHRLRPGYGYGNIPETTKNEKCPDTICIWKVNIATGAVTPLLKYTDFASFEPKENMTGAEHKVNHLMISPNGQRFMVLHRWFQNGVKYTRLVTCNMDGTDMFNLSDDDFVSHCCWKNDEEILSYLSKKDGGKGYYLMKDRTHEYEKKWPELIMDGHPTYSYDGRFAVTDTYPNRTRIQSIYIMQGDVVHRVARVFSPFKYGGDVRCDLHPRWSRDGKQICFDGSFNGKRAVCIVNCEEVTGGNGNMEYIDNPLISVVIPTHNRKDLLPRAIKSAQNQTYGNIEIIVVSDGSTDGTDEIMKEIESHDNRITYISYKPGKGGNYARNTGIKAAKGEYVAFLDDDDEWHSDKLEKQINIVKSDPSIGLICCGINSITEGVDYVTKYIPPAEYDSSKLILMKNCIGSTTTVMVKKDIFEQSGLFDEELGALQDYDLWIRICQHTHVGVVKESCVEYYNYKSSNQVSQYTDKYEKAVERISTKYEGLVETLTEEEKKERHIWLQLLLAKKCIRNGDPKGARKFVKKAQKYGATKSTITCWFATWFSPDTVNRVKASYRKIIYRK